MLLLIWVLLLPHLVVRAKQARKKARPPDDHLRTLHFSRAGLVRLLTLYGMPEALLQPTSCAGADISCEQLLLEVTGVSWPTPRGRAARPTARHTPPPSAALSNIAGAFMLVAPAMIAAWDEYAPAATSRAPTAK